MWSGRFFCGETGFLLGPASDSRRWCWPSRSSIALCSSTSAGRLVPPITESHQNPLSKVVTLLFWLLSDGMNSQPMSGQQNHSPSSTKHSRLICSDFTSTPHSVTTGVTLRSERRLSLKISVLRTSTCWWHDFWVVHKTVSMDIIRFLTIT